MWFTVCPLDPNLPALPTPVHYKQHKNHVEQILSKLKLKAWSLGSISAGNVKASSSVSGELQDVGVATLRGPRSSKKGKQQERYSREFLEMLESKLEETGQSSLARHTINEAKLAKLRSIVDVLRDTAGDTDDTSDTDSVRPTEQQDQTIPEFIKVFDTNRKPSDTADAKTIKKRRKRSKPSKKAGLRALLENSPDISSDSGDNLDDDGPPSSSLNKTSMAWLQSRKMEAHSRPLSDSFHTIPRLRESLNAGKMNRVSNYTFDNQSPEKLRSQSVSTSADDYSSIATKPKAQDRSHVTSKGGDSCEGPSDIQHYKVMDNRSSNAEEDSPVQSDPKYPSPVCKYYSVPVEISLHRINIVDVDKLPEMEIARSRSFGTKEGAGAKLPLQTDENTVTMGIHLRSRSLGELDNLESDDEVLVVRAPVASHKAPSAGAPAVTSSLDSPYRSRGRVASVGAVGGSAGSHTPGVRTTSHAPRSHSMSVGGAEGNQEVEGEEETSSLDFTSIRRQVDLMTAAASTIDHQRTSTVQRESFLSPEEPEESLVRSWQHSGEKEGGEDREETVRRGTMSKARSLDNLIADTLPRSKK